MGNIRSLSRLRFELYHFSETKACFYCGRVMLQPTKNCHENYGLHCTLDHMVSRSRGGHTTRENCIMACGDCNVLKGSLTIDEFAAAILYMEENDIPFEKNIRKKRKRGYRPIQYMECMYDWMIIHAPEVISVLAETGQRWGDGSLPERSELTSF